MSMIKSPTRGTLQGHLSLGAHSTDMSHDSVARLPSWYGDSFAPPPLSMWPGIL